ncbi:Ccr4-not transcription complex subunit [Thalictrum thalictroides]|uniref:Ccr4-not transcription complex subunit n=1 Tax=Thalictrum thalictroides TaxID=46969 RepID=A0A7J6X598_THATH|nr:Ccr4-not transcription complex subunit [Thalictrum thalictroides]
MEKGKCAMDSFKVHHKEEEVEKRKCLINNPSQDHLSTMLASLRKNQVNEADKNVYKPAPVLSRRVVAQRARREREKECSDHQSIKLANDARTLAQRTRRERERDQCNSMNEPNLKVETQSNFHHQQLGKSPIKLHTMSKKQPSYSQPTQCNSKNVPFSKVEVPSNLHHQQQGKSPIKLHTMTQKQPSSSQPNQQLASGNPPWLVPQQSPVLAQSPMKKFNTSAVMKHISVMLAAKKTNPVMGAYIYKDCGKTPGFSSRSSKATLPTQKKDNKSEIPSRTSLSSNGVLSKSASSTPGGNTAAAATVNAPPPVLAGERNASAVVLGPGSNHGVLDTSGFAIGSSPTKYSSPKKKDLIRRPSPSLPKTGFGSDPARFSVDGCDSNRSLISVPLSSGCVVASPSSLVEAPAVSGLAKGNTSGSDDRIETRGVMQPPLSSVCNRVMLPKISKVSNTTDLTESNNDGKPADLGGGVFSISEVPVEQWRLAREFSRTKMEQANPDTVLPNSDKQEPKETTLRTLKNDDSMMVPKPLISKDRGPYVDANMVSRIMIPAAESSQGPICPVNRSAGGHLVYTRKKSKQEPLLKNNNYEKDTNIGCTQQDHQEQQSSQQQAQSEGMNKLCFTTVAPIAVTAPTTSNRTSSPFLVKPLDELQSRELNHPTNSSSLTRSGTSQGMNEQHWRARFLRLETKLRNCDHLSHEQYIQTVFQRLPSFDHREHVVELERRAMKLLVEEGHELLMMKRLNVLGKPASVERFPTEN